MNFLDVRTVMFSHVLTDAVCIAVLASLWFQNRKRFAGTAYWLMDFVFQTIAVLLIVLRGSIPDWVSMGLSSTLVVAGALLGYIGLTLFVGKRSPQLHNYVLLAAFILVHLYFIFIQPSLEARNLNLSLGLLIMCFQCVWLVFRRVPISMRRTTLGVGLVYILFCVVSVVRIMIILVSPHPNNDFFKSGLYDTLVLVSFQILLILLTFGLTLMVNQQLLTEVKTQEEKFSKAFRSSPYAITITRASDGQIIEVNQAFLNLSGYSYPEVVGKSTVELQFWVNEKDRATVLAELLARKVVSGKEFQFRIKTGGIMTGLFSAEAIPINDQPHILSSIADITDRKQAEAEILQLNASLEQRVEERTNELHLAEEKLIRQERLAELGQMAGSIGHELRNPLGVISNAIYYLKMVQPDASDNIKKYLGIIENETSNSEKIITELLDFARISSVERGGSIDS